MKLKWVHIRNYRSCRDVRIDIGSMQALVGANNAGKSSIIRALDFLFNPSTTKVDEETRKQTFGGYQISDQGIVIGRVRYN